MSAFHAALAAAWLLGAAQAAPACPAGRELWLAPLDAATERHHWGLVDYDALFADTAAADALWAGVSVAKFYPAYLGLTPDRALRQALQALARRHVKIAFEASLLTPAAACGRQVAGDGGQATLPILARVKRLGGVIDILAMNEPLLHGWRARAQFCSDDFVAEVAANIAPTLRAARALFPAIAVGDVEAFGSGARMRPLVTALPAWAAAYARTMGGRLAFLQADIVWGQDWVAPLGALVRQLRPAGVPVGAIFNGLDLDASNADWVGHALAHVAAYQAAGEPALAAVVLQSWVAHPDHLLPATAADSFAGYVSGYRRLACPP